jgi:hypothetical protein
LAKVEQERLAKVEQERLAKVEQERLAKQEQERLAKQEQERLAKVEQERLAKVEQERARPLIGGYGRINQSSSGCCILAWEDLRDGEKVGLRLSDPVLATDAPGCDLQPAPPSEAGWILCQAERPMLRLDPGADGKWSLRLVGARPIPSPRLLIAQDNEARFGLLPIATVPVGAELPSPARVRLPQKDGTWATPTARQEVGGGLWLDAKAGWVYRIGETDRPVGNLWDEKRRKDEDERYDTQKRRYDREYAAWEAIPTPPKRMDPKPAYAGTKAPAPPKYQAEAKKVQEGQEPKFPADLRLLELDERDLPLRLIRLDFTPIRAQAAAVLAIPGKKP